MLLVLFDIDGTLLRCGPQVRPLFAAALEEVFGTAGDIASYSFSGKTDPQIVLDVATGAGVPAERARAGMAHVREAFLERLERGLDRGAMTLLPGVVELLEGLAADPQVELGLLTGNWEGGARIKLGRFDLNRFFAFGGFGEAGPARPDLLPAALEGARRALGRRVDPAEVLVVGDSTEDVACARAHGVPCVAVTTGWTAAESLRGAGAEWVVDGLAAAHAAGCFAAPAGRRPRAGGRRPA